MRCCILRSECVYTGVMEQPKPLRAAREAAGLDQAELAARAEITQATVSRVERGQVPGATVALRLARALNTTVEALFGHTIEGETTASPTLDATGTGG